MRNYESNSNARPIVIGAVIILGALISTIVGCMSFHCNDVQNLQIVQRINGEVEVRRNGGWYTAFCPRKWTYPKASVEICNEQEGDDVKMQFSNKTTASLNCQIGYRIDGTNDLAILRLHQQVEGNDDKIWQKVRTTLQTVAQCVASQYTPSESVENFPEFAKKISDRIIHEPNLLAEGIDVVSFTCAGLPRYDKETMTQFDKQKNADLAKRLAEADKIRLEAEKLTVEAQYARQIAEQKGQAEAEQAKAVQQAEKEKKLAEIEAQKQVEVARLEKEQMLIKADKEKEVAAIAITKEKQVAEIAAEKERAVAEIAKKTEAENLERVKLLAEQTIAKAEAKKKEIELSGAITETERVKLEIEKETRIGVAEAYAKGIAGAKLPAMWVTGGSHEGGATSNPIELLIQTMTLDKLNTIVPAAK